MHDEYKPFIRQRLIKDASTRSLGGHVMYIGIWVVVGFYFSLHERKPQFFYLNLSILTLITLFRFAHYQWIIKTEYNEALHLFKLRGFQILMLSSAFHWGLITCYILMQESLNDISIVYLLLSLAIGVAGSVVVSIDKYLGILYPFFMLSPVLYGLLHSSIDHTTFYFLSGLGVMPYIWVLNRSLFDDYWTAVSGEFEAKGRAKEYEALAKKFEVLSQTDGLTGLYNRLFFNGFYEREWKRAARQSYSLGLLLIDIDNFKQVNDTYGHSVGDECLKVFARCLDQQVQRSGDVVARYGGEEFVILLLGVDDVDVASIADRILEAVRQLDVNIDGQEKLKLTCSIGIATHTPKHEGLLFPEDVVNQSDLALYSAKQNGRDCRVIYNSKMLKFAQKSAR